MGLFVVLLVFYNMLIPPSENGVLLLITPASTSIPTQFIQQQTAQPTQYPPGVFAVGMRIVVTGTGGDGLRIRSAPGQQSEILALAQEGSLWNIIDGPQLLDGYVWWHIDQLDGSLSGWAVQDYMDVQYIDQ